MLGVFNLKIIEATTDTLGQTYRTEQERFKLIELLAYWEGAVNTKILSAFLPYSRQKLSDIIQAYKQKAPQNLYYDKQQRRYHASANFLGFTISTSAEEYLHWFSTGQFLPKHNNPQCAHLQALERCVEPLVMRALVQAMRQNSRLEVDYVSMSEPDHEGRIIVPLRFIKTGTRWHVRAWCEKRGRYSDFVLSRIRGIPEIRLEKIPNLPPDAAWNTTVKLIFAANPALAPRKREVIEHDYQMIGGKLTYEVRGCLVNYFLQEMQVNTSNPEANPEANQLVCVNVEAIKQWLFDQPKTTGIASV